MSSTQELKRLKVKTGVVQRIVKDLNVTKAEIEAQVAKVEKMKAEQADIYDIKKQASAFRPVRLLPRASACPHPPPTPRDASCGRRRSSPSAPPQGRKTRSGWPRRWTISLGRLMRFATAQSLTTLRRRRSSRELPLWWAPSRLHASAS